MNFLLAFNHLIRNVFDNFGTLNRHASSLNFLFFCVKDVDVGRWVLPGKSFGLSGRN